MTRLDALKELAAKAEAGGSFYHVRDAADRAELFYEDVCRAYQGSLDAAKSLHEAVLPGWGFEAVRTPLGGPQAAVWQVGHKETFDAKGGDPARAWLLAILRALIAQEEGR